MSESKTLRLHTNQEEEYPAIMRENTVCFSQLYIHIIYYSMTIPTLLLQSYGDNVGRGVESTGCGGKGAAWFAGLPLSPSPSLGLSRLSPPPLVVGGAWTVYLVFPDERGSPH